MVEITYEINGRKTSDLQDFANALQRDIAEIYRNQIEEQIEVQLTDLQPEMELEGGKLTVTVTFVENEANLNYSAEGFSDELEGRIFNALGFD